MTSVLTTLFMGPLLWVAITLLVARVRPHDGPLSRVIAMVVAVALTTTLFGAPQTGAILTSLLVWPALGALALIFTPRQWSDGIRGFASVWTWAAFVLSLYLLGPVVRDAMADASSPLGHFVSRMASSFFGDFGGVESFGTAGYRYVEDVPWIEAFGIHYKIGVDGISLWLIILTTLLTPLAIDVSWNSISTKVKEYAFAFLLLEVGMIGAFVALDLFLFYVFWELMLVPMYLIIGIWGGKDRVYAAVKFFVYTMVGSLLMLVAIVYVVMEYKAIHPSHAMTFDLVAITRGLSLPLTTQYLLFAAFGLAFAIKVPMFPFHTWLPDAHVQAPTGGSVILAAVLLKLGGYGFLRFAVPLFPNASSLWAPTLAGFAVVGIIYGAYCAWVQRDVKKLVAYSSVSHLGFVMLGVFSMNGSGVSGAILQMVSHGISTGALFILVGVIYDRRHTRDLADFGGIAKVMPVYATLFVIVAMSSIGLPGTNGFVGEFMILSSTFVSDNLGPFKEVQTLFAATGVILAAIYMLHAVLKTFWGPIERPENETLTDLTRREKWILAPLVALVFWIGLFPNFFLRPMEGAVDGMIAEWRIHSREIPGERARAREGAFDAEQAPADGAAEGQEPPAEAARPVAPERPRADVVRPQADRLAMAMRGEDR